MMQVDASDAIAALALVVSVLAFLESRRARADAKAAHDEAQRNAQAAEHSRLLDLLTDCEGFLDGLCRDGTALLREIDAAPAGVRKEIEAALAEVRTNHASMEESREHLRGYRAAFDSWSGDMGFRDLKRKQAEIYVELNALRRVAEQHRNVFPKVRENFEELQRIHRAKS